MALPITITNKGLAVTISENGFGLPVVIVSGELPDPPEQQAPSVQTVPTISGDTTVGSILTRTAGTATGIPTPTRATVWLLNGTVIDGQTGNTLDTTGLAADDSITTRDVWTNSQGTASGTSDPWVLTVQPAIAATASPDPLVAGQPASITFNASLTQAPTATGGATFTGSGTTWDFVVPEDATSITIGASLAGYTSYGETFEVVADPNSYTILRTPDYMLGIDTAMTSGVTPFEVITADDPRHVGIWEPDQALLQTGPVFVVDPEIDEQEPVAEGMPYKVKSGLFVFTPKLTGDPYDEVLSLEVDGVQKGDGLYGVGSNRVRQAITDKNGTRSQLSAPVILEAPTTMARNSVLFNGTAMLRHNVTLGPVTSFLMFAQFTIKGAAARQQLFGIESSTQLPMAYWDGSLRSTWIMDPSGSVTAGNTQFGAAAVDQRWSVLVSGHVSGADLVLELAHLRNAALTWQEATMTGAGKTAWRLSGANPGFSIGSLHQAGAGMSQPWFGMNHRLAFWVNTGTVDISSAGVRGKFLNAGTDDLMEVGQSYDAFGQPLFDLYGPAADYNAKQLNGSLGTAELIVGTFTNG